LEVNEWQNAIVAELANLTVDALSERRIRVFDKNGTKVDEIPDRNCFVFETEIKGRKYVLSNGEWFEVATSFDKQITKYVGAITRNPVLLPNFAKTWNGGEDQYVAEAAKSPDLMSLHKATCMINGTAIEACDLLHRTGALVHVKIWSQSAPFSHLL